MATKQSSSIKTTTNLQTGQTQTFRNTYKTSSSTNIGKGGLSAVGRLGMIGITILAISVGTALNEFTENDLILTAPNYNITNSFVPIDDPLNDINYVQYGEEVVERLNTFVIGFSDFGLAVKSYWDEVVGFFEPAETTIIFMIDFNRLFKSLEDASIIYDALSSSDKLAYGVLYPEINWLVKWMYYSPAELTA